MFDVTSCIDNAKKKMDAAVSFLEETLSHVRAGKANPKLLDGIRVESYGALMPIDNIVGKNIIHSPKAKGRSNGNTSMGSARLNACQTFNAT